MKATNADLVARAVTILEAMNVRVLGPAEVREKLQLTAPLMRVALVGGGVIGGGWAGRLVENGARRRRARPASARPKRACARCSPTPSGRGRN